jgi:hypothetical protein
MVTSFDRIKTVNEEAAFTMLTQTNYTQKDEGSLHDTK